MKQSKAIEAATDKAHAIDAETRSVLDSVTKKNANAVRWFVISWTILFAVGVFGIYKQNQIANQNKLHIDCIVKLFTTPLPIGARGRAITNPSTTCNIQFTK